MLRDSRARQTYILTKVGVLAVAALVTWPLARVIGPRAWSGLAVFAALLAAITVAVLVASATGSGETSETEDQNGDEEEGGADLEQTVEIPVEDSIDLHTFSPADIPDVVRDYLEAAHERGMREVRIIHGRGIGVQRERVRSTLSRHPLVSSFHDAPPGRGGWGATVAYMVEK
jgi:hypothetical protein